MKSFSWITGLVLCSASLAAADQPAGPLVSGLKNAAACAVGTDGKVYVTSGAGADGGGAVLVVEGGTARPFATGLNDPRGIGAYLEWLFVAERDRLLRVDRGGKVHVFVPAEAFPTRPASLRDVAVDPESGTVYASDAGDGQGKGAVVYRISPKGQVAVVTDAGRWPGLHSPAGILLDGASHLLLVDGGTGTLHRIKLTDRTTEPVAEGFGSGGGLAWDQHGRLFVGDRAGGRVLVIPRPGAKPVEAAGGAPADALCQASGGRSLLVLDRRAGTLTALPARVPGAAVDETPLPLETALAFPHLKWEGWEPENERGQVVPLRPLMLTHAGDGSNRVFVATEHGVIHVFPNDQQATRAPVFLDLRDRVVYDDNQNEEGFLGLAFHPKYKQNGEFFVFYTRKGAGHTNVLSRFRVRADDPNRADPASEEQLLRVTHPFWNHDGGTVCFGPDGYLYLALGDGGAANDPFENGQNLKTLLGKVLRLDVDHKGEGTNYAVPKDNPFVNRAGTRPEVWAYGLRNVWRMAFDRPTGTLWAADVGQNLYEEINHLTAGGNYGWNRREGLHPFGAKGTGPRPEFVEPIWEYHHDTGKSITGGLVYRGQRLPELAGAYLYADYVSGKIWALRYDPAGRRVVANRPIKDRALPILSFGEDEQGEVYLMTYSPSGQGIYRIVPSGAAK